MAEQKDLGKGVLISGIAAGIIALGGGYFMVPTAPVSKEFKVETVALTGIKASSDDGNKITKRLLNTEQHKVRDCEPGTRKSKQDKEKKIRVSPLFAAPELWQVTVTNDNGEKKNTVMDILDAKSEQVHPGIENSWFLKYGLKDALCVSNGPELDSDDDGFTHEEEYKLKTNPTAKEDVPELCGIGYIKLAAVETKTDKAYIELQNDAPDYKMLNLNKDVDAVAIRIYEEKKEKGSPNKTLENNKSLEKTSLKVGETFGIRAKEPNRFRLEKIEGCGTDDAKIVVVDTLAPKPGQEAGFELKPKDKVLYTDTWVTLVPTAGPKKGDFKVKKAPEGLTLELKDGVKEKDIFKLELPVGAVFDLPGAETKKCKLEAYNKDGAKGSCQISIEGLDAPVTAPKAEITTPKQPEKN